MTATEGEEDQLEPQKNAIMQSIEQKKVEITQKVQSIDHFMMSLNKKEALNKAAIGTYTDEVKRLRLHQKRIQKVKDWINKYVIPLVIETAGDGKKFETPTSKYTMFETWGPIEVTDEDAVPDKYKRAKIEIDKKGARSDIIEAAENDMGIAGFSISKVKRVRRS
jgi:hypothetical protein